MSDSSTERVVVNRQQRLGPVARTILHLAGFLLLLEVVTGALLMSVYAPTVTSAWGSVWYLETQTSLGWLVRAVHRFGADALVLVAVVFVLHLAVTAAYRLRGGRLWWAGLALVFVFMASALSGYALPWDQHGYWGTKVRTNILSLTPVVGDVLRRLVLGGPELGQLTLTRFYAAHVAVLPLAAFALILWTRRCGRVRAGMPGTPDERRADGQGGRACRAALELLIVLALVGLAIRSHGQGAIMLWAPADPASADFPARPEWFNLFLFQWLKGFQGPVLEVVGAILIPGLVLSLVALASHAERLLPPRIARVAVPGFALFLAIGAVALTVASIRADQVPSDGMVRAVRRPSTEGDEPGVEKQRILRAREYLRQRRRAASVARRSFALAQENGIPPLGPLELVRTDPMIRGPELFAVHCATCHRYDGHDGLGRVPVEDAASSDLAGFPDRSWIRGFLADPMAPEHFGRMKKPDGSPAHTQMSKWLQEQRAARDGESAMAEFDADLDAAAAYLAYESRYPGALEGVSGDDAEDLPADVQELARSEDGRMILRGRRVFVSVCNECHRYDGRNSGFFSAPEMKGYGSVDWTAWMIAEPDHDLLYRAGGAEPAQMPRFAETLSEPERLIIARWLLSSRQPEPK